MPVGWGRVPGHEVAFCDRLPFLLTTEASVPQKLQPALEKQIIWKACDVQSHHGMQSYISSSLSTFCLCKTPYVFLTKPAARNLCILYSVVAARLLQASLESLNGVLGEGQAVPMHRFRPNVVVSGTQAFEEDDWDTFTVSAPSHAPCKFKSVMPCDRCKVGFD